MDRHTSTNEQFSSRNLLKNDTDEIHVRSLRLQFFHWYDTAHLAQNDYVDHIVKKQTTSINGEEYFPLHRVANAYWSYHMQQNRSKHVVITWRDHDLSKLCSFDR